MPDFSLSTGDTNFLTLGGTPESQRDFLETFSADTSADPGLVNEKRKGKTPPIANQFALGYTYRDVLDADQEGAQTLAISFHMRLSLTFIFYRYAGACVGLPAV